MVNQPPRNLSDAQLREAFDANEMVLRKAQARRVALLVEIKSRKSKGVPGQLSTADVVAKRAKLSRSQASKCLHAANSLGREPEVLAALATGEVSLDQASALAEAKVPDEVRAELVEAASDLSHEQTLRKIRKAERAESSETAEERAGRAHAKRSCGEQRDRSDGMVGLFLKMTPEVAAEVFAKIRKRANEMLHLDRERGTPARSFAQRMHDAAVELILRDPAEGSGASRAKFNIVVDLASLLSDDPVGRTDFGDDISGPAFDRHACDAEFVATVLDAEGQVLRHGRSKRTATPEQWDALRARDRGCVIPGCESPPGYCHAHHLIHWRHGGKTDLENLALVCIHHHTDLHEGGWTLRRTDEGWEVLAPDPAGEPHSSKPTRRLFEREPVPG